MASTIFTGCGGSSDSQPTTNEDVYTLTNEANESTDSVKDVESIITKDSIVYETVISPLTQRVWLDKNLGATQVCTALDDEKCYGDYYQWGRDSDGHEKLETVTGILSDRVSNVGHADFITSSNGTISDWTTEDSDGSLRSFFWSKTDNDSICPIGFRVPTIEEINLEIENIENNIDALDNFLRLPAAGYASASNGLVQFKGEYGTIWSSSVDGEKSKHFGFYKDGTQKDNTTFRGGGFSIRCIQD